MSDNKSSGLGVVGATTLVFVVNKLTNAGDIAGWSWWWVLSPLWLTLAVVVFFSILSGILSGINSALDSHQDKKRRQRLRKL